jgi:FHA domain
MDQPATAHPATAREIILEVVRNMREGLEPLHYSTLAPAIYHVYLHTDDLDRLRGIVPRIVDEARRALDAEVEKLNQGSLTDRFKEKIHKRNEPKIQVPDGGWQVQILENTDEDAQPGDIVIYSELALPSKADLGAGAMTKRIATRRMGGAESTAKTTFEPAPSPPPAAAPAPGTYATIEYEDGGGRKTFCMTKDEIVVGRGGRDYWTDVKLDTLPDVSREHFRLRRDPATGKFFLKDLSRLGTTINGEKAPSSIEFVDGEKRDRNVEAAVPAQAKIGLAGVLTLDFKSA